jgi:hypothetical protein
MKKSIVIVLFAGTVLQSCTSQIYMAPQALTQTLQSGEFVFTAKRANPTNYAVINTINSIPNAPATRVLDLSSGYGIWFKKGQMEVVLPYFGRSYKAPVNTDQVSFRFTSKDYTMTKSSGKKEKIIYTIIPNDNNTVRKIYLEIYPTGSAMLSVDANDRQPISYDGYIEKLPVEK